ncbi:uncharacterized protein LAESUDRAFT_739345 [Laetiporus sulphureus 93-53]|uniref:PX-domain-containing protein n=1 Tax=Laetiporus sulphureus 93-53 TaxID=1314785 RepID=A0A165BH85_9APHY|nr:uncharacterized protein LAESUDRAFT_739345 [Laetiporus sulphureus 93-53]KZT01051.1 hypothetical protein LAESUDRAFT_739345 [Laetiporus sulphureus 93-53]
MSSDAAIAKPAFLLPTPQSLARPQTHIDTEFDSGVNSSAAWTGSLSLQSENATRNGAAPKLKSLSDEEPDDSDEEEEDYGPGCPARALFVFDGKPEFRELTCVAPGDELEVLKEDVGDGWSLVKIVKCREEREQGHEGEIGLLPHTFYTVNSAFCLLEFTADFARLPGYAVPLSHTRTRSRKEASGSSITPRGSPSQGSQALPLVPQTTGEWFPSFRRSLLGGRSLNRFSSFVTSGAEEWVLQGTGEEETTLPFRHGREASEQSINEDDIGQPQRSGETERHFVDAGPAWKSKIPAFRVLVHSPSKRSSVLTGPFTIYTLTSLFEPEHSTHFRSASMLAADDDEEDDTPDAPTSITVQRRFSHFVVLHTALTRGLPGIALPPLPEKQYAGRFNDEFVEARRGDLERYINRVVRHPIARYAEVLTFFLGCESEAEWKKQLPRYLALPPKGPTFYAQIYHPAFNVDAEDASEAVERFVQHTRAVGKGVQWLRGIFGKVREARVEMSKAERLLSYSLLSLITSKPLASASSASDDESDEQDSSKCKGHMNEDGAWCWRENCTECLRLTKAMQKTAESLQSVADMYDDHARRTQLATHEALKNVSHPDTIHAAVIDTHQSTLSRYQEAIQEGKEDEEMAARCETVLNTTMAEMDIYHMQKVEDFQTLAKDHLDGEIALYEQILTRLRAARAAFDEPQYSALSRSPRQSSRYERELEHPRLAPSPLPQPCPHVFDSAPIRPVSVAIQEGVGMLLGGANTAARGSILGKLW